MADPDTGSLQTQLDELSQHIPDVIATRIAAGAADIAGSGLAPGLTVGDTAPLFTLPDALGASVSLSGSLETGPVVVTFYRGEWCPFCNLQLRALQSVLAEIKELGASLVAISPQAPDHSLSITEKHELAFPVLSDVDQKVMQDYRVQFTLHGDLEDLQVNVFQSDPALQNADGSRSLPVPATFVIDRAGTVTAAFVSPDWRVRAEPDDILAALRRIAAIH